MLIWVLYFTYFLFFSIIFFTQQISAQELLAPQPEPSNITVKVEYVGSMPVEVPSNINSPVAYGKKELLLVDQLQGKLYSFKDGVSELIFDAAADFPGELMRESLTAETILNVVGDPGKRKLYVIFVAKNAPDGAPVHFLPFPDEPLGGLYDFIAIDDFLLRMERTENC